MIWAVREAYQRKLDLKHIELQKFKSLTATKFKGKNITKLLK